MQEERRKELLDYEKKNATIFQVIGSLKLMNIKVRNFVGKLERVNEDNEKQMHSLNNVFFRLQRDVQSFLEEFKCMDELDIRLPSVDSFSVNAKLLFMDRDHVYTVLEMRRIAVYLYRVADIMLNELRLWKLENDKRIHEIQVLDGKYYFNRK